MASFRVKNVLAQIACASFIKANDRTTPQNTVLLTASAVSDALIGAAVGVSNASTCACKSARLTSLTLHVAKLVKVGMTTSLVSAFPMPLIV